MTIRANRIERYYDYYEHEDDELVQSRVHYAALQYLLSVLKWVFANQAVGVVSEINFFHTEHSRETPKSPDVAAVDNMAVDGEEAESKPSYYVGEDGPPPRIAFEVSSPSTWRKDLEVKPNQYAQMGVLEYIAFDPNLNSFWTDPWKQYNRLIGWRLNPATQQYELIVKDEQGRIWSEQLQGWLAMDGQYLRLYTADGQRRLTKEEAMEQQAEAEAFRANQEQLRANQEQQRLEKLLERLKKHGINPDELV